MRLVQQPLLIAERKLMQGGFRPTLHQANRV